MFGLNYLWSMTLTPWFAGLFAKPIFGLLIDAVLKSLLFLALGVTTIYKLKISESVNNVIDKGLGMVRWK